MKLKVLTLAILTLTIPKFSNSDILIITASGADLVTTDLASANGLRESNPILKGNLKYPVKVIGTVGLCLIHNHIKKTHPKQAKIFKITVIALFSGMAVNNVIQMKRNSK